jgi:hypothetical protein
MAYYPTFQPYGYQDQLNQLRTANPMPGQMPMQGFQQYPTQLPMQQTRQDANGLIWVQGEAGAKSWFVAPGATVLLMDSENPRFYMKSADMNGVPAMRTFEYNEVGAQKLQEVTQTANFVTLDEFNEFKEEVLNKLSEPVEVSLSRKKKGVNADE